MEDIRGIQHPLQTPLVLECIFKNLNVSDLKACREVCRAWHKEATPVVRPITRVSIQGEEEGRGIADFLELVQTEASTFSQSPFVEKFQIYDFIYAENEREFWDLCGRSIKTLDLINASFPTDNEFGHALIQSCPNLEELSLDDVKVNPEGNAGDQPLIWVPPRFPQNRNLKFLEIENNHINGLARMEILSHFPCLEKLQLLYSSDKVDWIFRSLKILRDHDNQGWPLKSVAVNFSHLEEPLAILPVLVEGNLALEEFNAYGIDEPEQEIALRSILEAHANCLKKLSVGSGSTWENMDMDGFPALNNMRLDKLEYLCLIDLDLSSTNFLRSLPNLSRLKIHRSDAVQHQPEDPNDEWILPRCTELTLDDEELKAEDLQDLLRRLPNLKKLKINYCGNKIFAVICELCPKLTYLHLWRCKVNNCGISGLDLKDVRRINREGANGWTWWRPITVARPNLSSLKCLKWFRFSADKPPGFCAALCGIQQLPQLQHLRLEGFPVAVPIWKRLIDQYPWVDQ